MCTNLISVITFIRYDHSQKIGMSNNVKSLRAGKPQALNRIDKIG